MSSVIKLKPLGKYRVEKNVPLPRKRSAATPCPFPFLDMNVGDSFLVGGDQPRAITSRLNRWWGRFRKQHPEGDYQFSARTVDGGVRCWRVK